MNKLISFWKKYLPLLIILGMFLGIVWAVLSVIFGLKQVTIDWLKPFGDIFINLLKLIAVPLVLFSVIKGVSSISSVVTLGRMGGKTLFAYLFTTIIAVALGLFLVNFIKPGETIPLNNRIAYAEQYSEWLDEQGGYEDRAKLLNLRIDSLNQSIITPESLLSKDLNVNEATELKISQENIAKAADVEEKALREQEKGPLQFIVDMVPSNIFVSLTDNTLMLQIIFFAVFFGVTLVLIPKNQADPLIAVFDAFNTVFLKMVEIVMFLAPFFVFALLSGVMAEIAGDSLSNLGAIFKALGVYSLVVVLGLSFLVFCIYPIFMYVFAKKSFFDFFRAIFPAQMLAFSTSSSAATLPVTMDCVNNRLRVPEKVSNFVLPIGATVNMDGTSLYQAVAVIFLAQMHMVDLSIAEQLTIVLMTTMASIGSAAVPGAGLIMLILVLDSVGLNPAWISIIIPMDRLLDMFRTVVNVTGDATVSSVIASSENRL